jgi:outer membrane receptor protein involved in Fe transport
MTTWTRNKFFALFVDNLLDEEYISSALSRQGIYPGNPRNVRASLEFRF